MKFGTTHTVNASEQDPVAAVRELTGGMGADYTFEAVGSAKTIRAAYDMAVKSSTVTLVGLPPFGAEACVDAVDMVRMEKTMRGTYYGSTHAKVDMPKFAELYRLARCDRVLAGQTTSALMSHYVYISAPRTESTSMDWIRPTGR